MTDSVAVVIPVLSAASHLRQLPELLRALRAQERLPDEVILAGHRIKELAPAYLNGELSSKAAPPVRLVNTRTGTIPTGLNQGIAAARSRLIIRLDVHARPRPDYVRRCVDLLASSGAAMVGGRLEIHPRAAAPFARAIALAVGHPLGAGDARYRLAAGGRPGPVDIVPYACFRKSTWQQLGGFSEALFANEDYEFCWRLRRAGGRVHLEPSLQTHYYARADLRDLARQYFRYGWWKIDMLRRNPVSARLRQVLPLLALALLVATLAASPFIRAAQFVLFGAIGLYGLTLLAACVQLAARRRDPALLATLPLAFLTVHFAWSSGGWANLLSARRWPAWPPPSTAPQLYE